ncbi:hypothetical protein [Myxosarcina sp. GI1(2024)]
MYLTKDCQRLLYLHNWVSTHSQELFNKYREQLFSHRNNALFIIFPESHVIIDPFTNEEHLKFRTSLPTKDEAVQQLFMLGATKKEKDLFLTALTTYRQAYRVHGKEEIQLPVVLVYNSSFLIVEMPVLVNYQPQEAYLAFNKSSEALAS